MTMKIHPGAQKKRAHTTTTNGVVSSIPPLQTPKKLKRLPHVFAKVLELPFNSDADVFVQETPDSFRFLADKAIADHFQARVIKILPGVTKIEVRGGSGDCSSEEFDIDSWRFRLPPITLPEMATAVCIGGKLVVTVPKAMNSEDNDCDYKEDEKEILEDDNGKENLFVLK